MEMRRRMLFAKRFREVHGHARVGHLGHEDEASPGGGEKKGELSGVYGLGFRARV